MRDVASEKATPQPTFGVGFLQNLLIFLKFSVSAISVCGNYGLIKVGEGFTVTQKRMKTLEETVWTTMVAKEEEPEIQCYRADRSWLPRSA